MKLTKNTFKQALAEGRSQIGLWVGLADPNAAEALAATGFDWLLIDGEHAPNDPRQVLEQLRAAAPYPVHPVVRPVQAEVALIKQYLDIGAQTLLVPMINTAQEAALTVRAMRYPPHGIRGVGAALARASRWNQVDNYLHVADGEMCLLVQAESVQAIRNLQSIAEVDGVDGVFFGPADLAASMGRLGEPGHPEVQQVILDGIATVKAAGKAAGILSADLPLARRYLEAGAQFVAIGVDTTLLVRAASDLVREFKNPGGEASVPGTPGAGY